VSYVCGLCARSHHGANFTCDSCKRKRQRAKPTPPPQEVDEWTFPAEPEAIQWTYEQDVFPAPQVTPPKRQAVLFHCSKRCGENGVGEHGTVKTTCTNCGAPRTILPPAEEWPG
jgi:hypothetical protein